MSIVSPQVTLIASTEVHYSSAVGNEFQIEGMETELTSSEMDDLVEFAGRSCYQSFHKPNPATAANVDYLANILRQGHGSVLEHASATFYIEGVSRALTHELIRHRHLSYSQVSQRFVNEAEADIVLPPAAVGDDYAAAILNGVDGYTKEAYSLLVEHLQGTVGLPRKQAREAARAALPNMTETKIVVTGNLRAWRDVLGRRLDPSADAEIREVSQMILVILKEIAPASFQDFDLPDD